MNWKILQTKGGKLSYAACNGDKLIREFEDIAYALKYEEREEFRNSLNDFMIESKLRVEARQRGEYFENKIVRVNSTEFRSLQNKIKKQEEKERLKDGKSNNN